MPLRSAHDKSSWVGSGHAALYPDTAAVRLTFLGTSAGTPTKTRNVTSQLLQFDDGRSWLLDCGEGTQHQMLRAGFSAARIDRILITHLHGDHCYGLFGMLSLIAIHGRSEAVEVIGPAGLAELLGTVLRLSVNQLSYRLEIREVGVGEPPLVRGAWTVSAWPLVHRVPCFGYVLQEAPHPGRFHPERATALGIPVGPLYGRLQAGQAVMLADGRRIEAQQVCDPPRPGRKLVLLGDTCDSSAIAAAGANCDLLVHEATYDAGREDKALHWGHSTTTMAGRFAAQLKARVLILTHLSSRYHDQDAGKPTPEMLLEEAASACPGCRVVVADDLVTIDLPLANATHA